MVAIVYSSRVLSVFNDILVAWLTWLSLLLSYFIVEV